MGMVTPPTQPPQSYLNLSYIPASEIMEILNTPHAAKTHNFWISEGGGGKFFRTIDLPSNRLNDSAKCNAKHTVYG